MLPSRTLKLLTYQNPRAEFEIQKVIGAGSRSPELAGRYAVFESVAVAPDRIRDQRHPLSMILIG